jgi:nucleotide-binding universal stress UspA family protein
MSSLDVREVESERPRAIGRVVAGFHWSSGAEQSIEWAAREAAARGTSLRIAGSPGAAMPKDLARALQARHPDLTVDFDTINFPRDALIGAADSADLLVLSASEGESAWDVLHGSLARRALRRSPCPVVVVRGRASGPVKRIVVGVDGSSASGAALDWACDEATIHGSDLVVIHAREGDISRAEAGCVLDLAVNECRDRTAGIVVRGVLAEGSPVQALIAASRLSDLVAVGSRGHSGFKTALFGSVALSLAEHADCPVAITHPRVRLD